MSRAAVDRILGCLHEMPPVGTDWRPLLSTIGSVFRSHIVAFQSHDLRHRQGTIDTSIGFPVGMGDRFKALAHEHPWYLHGGERLFDEGFADDRGLLPERELYDSRFHGEVLVPLDVGHGMALVLRHAGPEHMTVLSINRSREEGYFTSRECALARSLLPHLRTTYLLQQRLGWMETLARTFRASLDRLDEGVVILDRRGFIRFANIAAERYAAQAIYARCPDGRLRLPTQAQSNALQTYLRTTVSSCPDSLSLRILDAHGQGVATLKACLVEQLASEQWGEPEAGFILFFSAAPA